MNDAHLHLAVNHLPIIFPVVGIIILITGLISKSEAVKRTAYFIFSIGSLTAIAAMTTGEGAEEIVEKIAAVNENYIETHEHAAETFAVLSYILGALSLMGLWASFKQKTFSGIFNIVTLVFACVVLYFGTQTGTTGGEIRHTEIRSGYSSPALNGNSNETRDDD